MSWSKNQVALLIDLYETKPSLYNSKCSLYKNKHARNEALLDIERKLKHLRPETSVVEIKAKINALRTNFLREHRLYMQSQKSGVGATEVKEPNIWYYHKLKFILEHCIPRKSFDSISVSTEPSCSIVAETEQVVEEESNYEVVDDLEEITIEVESDDTEINQEMDITKYESTRYFTAKRVVENISGCETPNSIGAQDNKKQTKKKCKRERKNETDQLLEVASVALTEITNTLRQDQTVPTSNRCHEDIFGEFVASKLKMIQDSTIKKKIEGEICEILFKY